MPRRIQIAPHLSLEELEQRDRQAKARIEQSLPDHLAPSPRETHRGGDGVDKL